MELTLASYNIHSGIGTDGQFNLQRTAEVLRETAADLIALQEVGDFRGATPHQRHAEVLAEALGMKLAFGPNVIRAGRRYGNAILSRLPIARSRNYDLSIHAREPRGALRCDVEVEGGKHLHLFCIHLGLTVSERRKQEALLLSADILRDALRDEPVIVCGDFNYWRSGPTPSLVRGAIEDAAQRLRNLGRTYPSRFPLFRLDRIYVDAGVEPAALQPHRSELSLKASDHLPLVMRFRTKHPGRLPEKNPVQWVA